jgi:hypothetical protein
MCPFFFHQKGKNLLYRLQGPIFFFCWGHAKFCQKQKYVAKSGNHLYGSLAKFGYEQDMNSKKNLIILCIFGYKLEAQ